MISIRSIVLFCLSLSAFNNTLSAAENRCEYYDVNDDYYELEQYQLSDDELTVLEKLTEQLIDDWRGTLVQHNCKGHNSDRYLFSDNSDAKVEIKEYSQNRLEFTADLDFEQQNKRVDYLRHLFERRNLIGVLSNDEDAYIITEKGYYRSDLTGRSSLIETVYKILFSGQDQLQLDIVVYHNGLFSEQQQWQLQRW